MKMCLCRILGSPKQGWLDYTLPVTTKTNVPVDVNMLKNYEDLEWTADIFFVCLYCRRDTFSIVLAYLISNVTYYRTDPTY